MANHFKAHCHLFWKRGIQSDKTLFSSIFTIFMLKLYFNKNKPKVLEAE